MQAMSELEAGSTVPGQLCFGSCNLRALKAGRELGEAFCVCCQSRP